MKKRILVMLLVALAGASLVFAQAKTSLNIQCNQVGAKVYLNDNLAGYTTPNFSALVTPGLYYIKVTKDGFPDFKTTVVVGSTPITITANFGSSQPPTPPAPPPAPVQHQLSVDSNVRNAQVYIDKTFAGTTPFVGFYKPGMYTITIKVPGYEEYSQRINLTSSFKLYATLNLLPLPVYFDVNNVRGASVYRDGQLVGTTPYSSSWLPGSYTLRVSAPGYADYNERIILSGPLVMQISLSPLLIDYEIRIPDSFLVIPGSPVVYRNVQLYLDGRRVDQLFGKALPGKHVLTLYINDLKLEAEFDLPGGKPVVIEPFFGIRVQ